MRKLLALAMFGMLLGGMAGCRIGECWREAWCSHCRPQQSAVIVGEPCMMSDPCCTTCAPCGSPCGSPCGGSCGSPCAAPMLAPGPVVSPPVIAH